MKTLEHKNKFRQTVLDMLLEKGRIENALGSFALRTGEKIPVSFSGSVIKDAEGQTTDLVVVAKDLRELKEYARKKLAAITPVLQKVSMGDFSEGIKIPEEEDEFTEHLVALNLMVDDLKELTTGLENKVRERTQELEAANQQLRATTQQLETSEQQLRAANQQLEMRRISLEAEVKKRTAELQQAKAGLEIEVAERTKELQNKLAELEGFNRVAVGRELKMIELKNRIAELETPEVAAAAAAAAALSLTKEVGEIPTEKEPREMPPAQNGETRRFESNGKKL